MDDYEFPWATDDFGDQIDAARDWVIREWSKWAEKAAGISRKPESPWKLFRTPYPAPPMPVGPLHKFILPTWWAGFREAAAKVDKSWTLRKEYRRTAASVKRRQILASAKYSTERHGGRPHALYLTPRPTWTKKTGGTPSKSRLRFARKLRGARGSK